MTTAVLCGGKGGVFFSPAGGGADTPVLSVSGAAVFPFPQTVVPLSARSGFFFCPGRIAYGKERAYDQKL